MGKITMRAREEKVRRKVEETLEKTVIHQRQADLALGRWDFVVFGPSTGEKRAVVRVGVAQQATIQSAGVYVASVGDPAAIGFSGMMSIEELAGDDVSEELHGLEVYHVAPLRPLSVSEKRYGEDLDRMREKVLEDYSDVNTAIIETPDEQAWSLAALKYLNECDDLMPDPLISTIRKSMTDTSMKFGGRQDYMH